MLESFAHSTLLTFWIQLLVIFVVARLLGTLAKKIGLPSVVGELSAGLFLGPSILGQAWPQAFDIFLPSENSEVQSAMLLAIISLSAMFLLAVAGYSTDLALIKRLGRSALFVTAGCVVVPLVAGVVVGAAMPKVFYGLNEAGEQSSRLVFTMFVAAALAGSALAVIAKVLADLNLMRRDVGQITIAASMANDLVGWMILGVITGLATSGELSWGGIAFTVIGLGLFLAFSLTVGQRLVDASLRVVRRKGKNLRGALSVTLGTMFVFGVITQALGVEAVLGAFVAGIVLAKSRYEHVDAQAVSYTHLTLPTICSV